MEILFLLNIDLISWDHQLFFFINKSLSNEFFDLILPLMRNKYTWIPFYVFVAAFMLMNYKGIKWLLILFVIMNMTMSDQMSSTLVKENVQRLRPCQQDKLKDQIILRVPCKRSYSFTSSHATNHFAIAAFLFFVLGSYLLVFRWPLFVWAGIISFSQVYVGIHFPLDILFGAILGVLIGSLNAYLFKISADFFEAKKVTA